MSDDKFDNFIPLKDVAPSVNGKPVNDNVNHPSHYENGSFECIDVMLETQVLHFKVVLLSCTFLEIQLRVVRDHSERLTSYRGVKFNLSRFFSIFPPKILLHFPLIAVTGGICRYGIKVFQ